MPLKQFDQERKKKHILRYEVSGTQEPVSRRWTGVIRLSWRPLSPLPLKAHICGSAHFVSQIAGIKFTVTTGHSYNCECDISATSWLTVWTVLLWNSFEGNVISVPRQVCFFFLFQQLHVELLKHPPPLWRLWTPFVTVTVCKSRSQR